MLKFVKKFNLPSGSIFVNQTETGYYIESTMMQDVSMGGKFNREVRDSLDPNVIWKHLIPIQDKLLMTVSTQKGCVHHCQFCDVAPLPFCGNLSYEEIMEQIDMLLMCLPEYVFRKNNEKIISNKGKIGFSRMGEPSHNLNNVLNAIETLVTDPKYKCIKWLPCFNSILPMMTLGSGTGPEVVQKVLDCKEEICNGMLHFQISCNSTDERIREQLFGGIGVHVMELPEIIDQINSYPKITKRTVTLNFIVMENIPIDVDYLMKIGLNPERFVVKLIPLNESENSKKHGLKTKYDYNSYDELQKYAEKFKDVGIPVVFDAVCKAETAGICCGQLVKEFY